MSRIAYYFRFVASSDFVYAFELQNNRLTPLNSGKPFLSDSEFFLWARSNGYNPVARFSALQVQSITENANTTATSESNTVQPNPKTNSRRGVNSNRAKARRPRAQTTKGVA